MTAEDVSRAAARVADPDLVGELVEPERALQALAQQPDRRLSNGQQTKPSNPKDAIGSAKLDMGLVPWTLMVCAARAFLEGALKYGRFNWRIAGVRAGIYHAACLRHIAKWWNGQNVDKKTRVHHLDNAIACLTIIRDAELYGKLTDDRPPCPDPDAMADLIDSMEADVSHLKEMFIGHSPKQFTIADTQEQNHELG